MRGVRPHPTRLLIAGETPAVQEIFMENRRNSKIKRVRKSGFRARMRTSKGRNIINKRRSSNR